VADNLARTEALLDFARAHGLARLTLDAGYGPETTWEPDPATITLGGTPVSLPPGAFLQATADGEAALVAAAQDWLAGRRRWPIFSGLGTFAFALPGRAVWRWKPRATRISPARRRRACRADRSTRCTATCSATRCAPMN
jgi:hypothetical protein